MKMKWRNCVRWASGISVHVIKHYVQRMVMLVLLPLISLLMVVPLALLLVLVLQQGHHHMHLIQRRATHVDRSLSDTIPIVSTETLS
jgi:hypothetical protein